MEEVKKKRTRRKPIANEQYESYGDMLKEAIANIEDVLAKAELVWDAIPDENKKDAQPVKLYVVNTGQMEVLKVLRDEHDARIPEDSRLNPYRFKKAVNLLNPDKVAHNYNVVIHPAFVQVNHMESVERYVFQNLAVSANNFAKELNETLKNKEELADALAIAKHDADEAKEKLEQLMANPDKYEVRISTKKRAYDYAYVHINSEALYLSDQRPNVLHYEVPQLRPNDAHSRYMKRAKHLYGDIYYAIREEYIEDE